MSGLTNYSPSQPLILLTDYSPHFPGGGAVILRSAMDAEARKRVVWVTLTPGGDAVSEVNDDERVVVLKGGPGAKVPRTKRSLFVDTAILAGRLADELEEIAQAHSARGYWIVMHGAAVPIAANLVKRGKRPIVATVHDDPAFGVALRSRRYLAILPLIESAFSRALKGSEAVDVISQGMIDRYGKRYGIKGTYSNRAVEPTEPRPSTFDKSVKTLRIGVLGNTYSYNPLPTLGRAVAKAAADLGVRGELVFVGHGQADRLRAELGDLIDVVGTGQVTEERGIEVLRSCFLQYLNYPFGWRDRVLRQTSFPSKLATYLQAGRPLLLHTPTDSSTAELTQISDLAWLWDDMAIEHGAEILKKAWADPQTSLDANVPLEIVRRRYFDAATNRSAMMGMLNRMVGPLG